jgi:hypothetical protein
MTEGVWDILLPAAQEMMTLCHHLRAQAGFALVELTDIRRAQCRGFGQYLRLSFLKGLSNTGGAQWTQYRYESLRGYWM